MLTLHRRLPLAPGGKREGAVAYEWQCHCGSEVIMLGLANRLEERKAALRQQLFDAQPGRTSRLPGEVARNIALGQREQAGIAIRCPVADAF